MKARTGLVLLDDLHHLAHVQADLGALLLLVVCDGHILVQEQRVRGAAVPCNRHALRYITLPLLVRKTFENLDFPLFRANPAHVAISLHLPPLQPSVFDWSGLDGNIPRPKHTNYSVIMDSGRSIDLWK